jgi:hypothetical protein
LFGNALHFAILINFKLKEFLKIPSTLDNTMDDDVGIVVKLALLVSNIKRKFLVF